jgi:hypothetical protein
MKPQNAPGFIPEKYKEPPVCEACGQEFACGAMTGNCWCMSVDLSEKDREHLKATFKNCLCQNCLEKFNSAEV